MLLLFPNCGKRYQPERHFTQPILRCSCRKQWLQYNFFLYHLSCMAVLLHVRSFSSIVSLYMRYVSFVSYGCIYTLFSSHRPVQFQYIDFGFGLTCNDTDDHFLSCIDKSRGYRVPISYTNVSKRLEQTLQWPILIRYFSRTMQRTWTNQTNTSLHSFGFSPYLFAVIFLFFFKLKVMFWDLLPSIERKHVKILISFSQ